MKKSFLVILLVFSLLACLAVSANAETFYGGEGWNVVFNSDGRLDSSFSTSEMTNAVSVMQPGDTVIMTLDLVNQNTMDVDWYMTNTTIASMEDTSATASGGAYTFIMTYTAPDGQVNELFNSDTVGGEGQEGALQGLHEATNAMEDYFYLDTMSAGEQGVIRLEITLEGETQGNDYQSGLADLQMNFAVEAGSTTYSTPPAIVQIVRSGDENNMVPYLVAMGVSGALLLVLAFYSLKKRKTDERGA